MNHDRLQHISVFRAGFGLCVASNVTIGEIGKGTDWMVEHLEMALANWAHPVGEGTEILHAVQKLPWRTPEGERLTHLRIRIAPIQSVGASIPKMWFDDYPHDLRGDLAYITSVTFVHVAD